jgi:hypothetical protein
LTCPSNSTELAAKAGKAVMPKVTAKAKSKSFLIMFLLAEKKMESDPFQKPLKVLVKRPPQPGRPGRQNVRQVSPSQRRRQKKFLEERSTADIINWRLISKEFELMPCHQFSTATVFRPFEKTKNAIILSLFAKHYNYLFIN